jgi:hypothetical protein
MAEETNKRLEDERIRIARLGNICNAGRYGQNKRHFQSY